MLRTWFSLEADRADDADIDARTRADVPLHGTKLWVLVFAICIALIVLNVNSTAAVIIGAMLISKLMGPITSVGYGTSEHSRELLTPLFAPTPIEVVASEQDVRRRALRMEEENFGQSTLRGNRQLNPEIVGVQCTVFGAAPKPAGK